MPRRGLGGLPADDVIPPKGDQAFAAHEQTQRLVEVLSESCSEVFGVPAEKYSEPSPECGIAEVGITGEHRQRRAMRESYLTYLSVGRIGQAERARALDNVPATLEEENRRLRRVVVREEG